MLPVAPLCHRSCLAPRCRAAILHTAAYFCCANSDAPSPVLLILSFACGDVHARPFLLVFDCGGGTGRRGTVASGCWCSTTGCTSSRPAPCRPAAKQRARDPGEVYLPVARHGGRLRSRVAHAGVVERGRWAAIYPALLRLPCLHARYIGSLESAIRICRKGFDLGGTGYIHPGELGAYGDEKEEGDEVRVFFSRGREVERLCELALCALHTNADAVECFCFTASVR